MDGDSHLDEWMSVCCLQVDRAVVGDAYFDVVETPMDLGTIRCRSGPEVQTTCAEELRAELCTNEVGFTLPQAAAGSW